MQKLLREFFAFWAAKEANCFGDACDLSVYPDQYLAERCEMVNIGCHNLDNADQQLTLLAGLVKIAELARIDRS